jgi:hypothetical protein
VHTCQFLGLGKPQTALNEEVTGLIGKFGKGDRPCGLPGNKAPLTRACFFGCRRNLRAGPAGRG